MSGYKLIGDHKNHYVVQHPDGKSIPIAKSGLSKETHARIKAMGSPIKMADGGVVPDDQNSSSLPAPDSLADIQAATASPVDDPAQSAPVDSAPISDFAAAKGVSPDDTPQPASKSPSIFSAMYDAIKPGSALPKSSSDQSVATTPSSATANANDSKLTKASYESGTPDPAPAPTPDKGMDPNNIPQVKAINGTEGAMAQFQKSVNAANKDADSARDQLIKGQQVIDQTHQANLQNLNKEQHDLSDRLMSGKMDPNRMWNSMSTGNKVLASISLILGGIGSGATGKNAALDVMNNAINRDMEAQKGDVEKTKYALSANRDAQNSENADYAQKKASLLTTAQAQLAMAAQKTGSAQAMMNAKQVAAQLEMQKAQILGDYSMKKSVIDAVQANPGNPGILGRAVATLVPEKQQEPAFKELDRVSAAYKAKDAINKYMGSANDKNTVMGRIMHGGFQPADMNALEANVMPVIKDLEGRVNEREMEVLHGLYPSPGDSADKVKTKMAGLNDFINAKSQSSLLSAYGLMPKYQGAYDNQGQKRFHEGAPNLQ